MAVESHLPPPRTLIDIVKSHSDRPVHSHWHQSATTNRVHEQPQRWSHCAHQNRDSLDLDILSQVFKLCCIALGESDMKYINDTEINMISSKSILHKLYSNLLKKALKTDSLILKEISEEISINL